MTKLRLTILGILAPTALALGGQLYAAGVAGNDNCKVELIERVVSSNGKLAAEHRRGVCDDGMTIMHTLEIAPIMRSPSEKVAGALLHRAHSSRLADPKFAFRWIANDQLEVSHPSSIAFAKSFVLSGVRVIGKPVD